MLSQVLALALAWFQKLLHRQMIRAQKAEWLQFPVNHILAGK